MQKVYRHVGRIPLCSPLRQREEENKNRKLTEKVPLSSFLSFSLCAFRVALSLSERHMPSSLVSFSSSSVLSLFHSFSLSFFLLSPSMRPLPGIFSSSSSCASSFCFLLPSGRGVSARRLLSLSFFVHLSSSWGRSWRCCLCLFSKASAGEQRDVLRPFHLGLSQVRKSRHAFLRGLPVSRKIRQFPERGPAAAVQDVLQGKRKNTTHQTHRGRKKWRRVSKKRRKTRAISRRRLSASSPSSSLSSGKLLSLADSDDQFSPVSFSFSSFSSSFLLSRSLSLGLHERQSVSSTDPLH